MTKWVRFLIDNDICQPDYYGNMPCDNGAYCNKCQEQWVLDAWKELNK